jgi:hypothetical protein
MKRYWHTNCPRCGLEGELFIARHPDNTRPCFVCDECSWYCYGPEARTGQAPVDRLARLVGKLDLGAPCLLIAGRTPVLELHVLDALEVAGDVFQLPGLLLADALAIFAAAGAALLVVSKVMLMALQVKAARNDAYVQSRTIAPEIGKREWERDRYLHPELHGQPPQRGINYQPR